MGMSHCLSSAVSRAGGGWARGTCSRRGASSRRWRPRRSGSQQCARTRAASWTGRQRRSAGSRGRQRAGAPTAITTRSSSVSAGTLKVTGGRSTSMDGALTAGAAEQQGNLPAPVPSRLHHILGAQHFGSLGSLRLEFLA